MGVSFVPMFMNTIFIIAMVLSIFNPEFTHIERKHSRNQIMNEVLRMKVKSRKNEFNIIKGKTVTNIHNLNKLERIAYG